MAKIFRDLFLLAGIFGGIVIAYVQLKQQFPDALTFEFEKNNDWELITEENEKELGKLFLDELLEHEILVNDSQVQANMQIVYDRLLTAASMPDTAVSFYIVRNNSVNALTLPGGNIVIFTGLIELSEKPEQLAAVIAHELGHVYHEHVMEKLLREVGMSVVLSIITGGDPSIIHEISSVVLSNVFSREHESEADAYALKVLTDAQIDPKAMAEFFEILNRENLSYAQSLEWLMSHPHNDSRIKASNEHLLPPGFEAVPFEMDWSELQDRL